MYYIMYLFISLSWVFLHGFVRYSCHVNIVILSVVSTFPYMRTLWLAIKPGSIHHVFLICNVGSQEYDSCYQIVCFKYLGVYFCSSSVYVVSMFFFCVFPSILFCDADLFSLNRLKTIEQRYTTIAFRIRPIIIEITKIPNAEENSKRKVRK